MEKEKDPEYLTVNDIMTLLPLSKDSIYRLIKLPGFPTIHIGGRYLVEKKDLFEWLAKIKGKDVNLG